MCLRHPRVWGVGFLELEGASQKAVGRTLEQRALEHAARNGPVIPWAAPVIWNRNAALSRSIVKSRQIKAGVG